MHIITALKRAMCCNDFMQILKGKCGIVVGSDCAQLTVHQPETRQ